MSAKREAGNYTINLKYTPSNGYPEWVIGQYRITIRRPGTRHNLEESNMIIWTEPSKAGYGYAPEELGLTKKQLDTSHGYDVVARREIEDLHDRWPNRTLFIEILDYMREHGLKRAKRK